MRIRRISRLVAFTALASTGVFACSSDATSTADGEETASSSAALWTDYERAGFSAPSGVAVSSWAPGRLDVFYIGTDNTLRHRYTENNRTFSAEENLGGSLTDAPAAVSSQYGRIDIVARTTSGTVAHKSWNNGWSAWEELGSGPEVGPPVLAARGKLDGDFRGPQGGPRLVTGPPAIASWAAGRLDVFALRGTSIVHRSFDGGWSAWETLDGDVASAPAAVSSSRGHIDLVALNAAHQVIHRTFDGAWRPWENLDGYLTSTPAIASWGAGRLDVFARGGDNGLWHKSFRSGAWYDWQGLGGGLGSAPTAIAWQQNEIAIFLQGTDGQAYEKTWTEPEATRTGSQLAAFRKSTAQWFLDKNRNQVFENGTDLQLTFGVTGDLPAKVRTNGNSQDLIATFNGGKWTVDSNNDGLLEPTDRVYSFGSAGDVPVSGNWSATGIGVFNKGVWFLDTSGDGAYDATWDDEAYFGQAGDIPVVGDWTGDGVSKIGVFRNGVWLLDMNGNFTFDAGDATFYFGGPGDQPIVGQWGPGKGDALGVVAQTSVLFLDANGDHAWGVGDRSLPYYAGASDVALVGNFAIDVFPVMGCMDAILNIGTTGHCGLPGSVEIAKPLTATLRNDANDPTLTETITYESEFVTTVQCAGSCPTTFQLAAGSDPGIPPVAIAPGNIVVRPRGNGPLVMSDTAPATTAGKFYKYGTHVYVKPWYVTPTNDTLARWLDLSKDQAKIVQQSVDLYTLSKSYSQLASFNQTQLDVLITKVTQWRDAATGAERLKWTGVLNSLLATKNGQPLPVSPDQAATYLAQMVAQSNAEMLLQAARAQGYLDLFSKAQADLDRLTATINGEIDEKLAIASQNVKQFNKDAIPKLEAALIIVAKSG